jgi:hypothetical protein
MNFERLTYDTGDTSIIVLKKVSDFTDNYICITNEFTDKKTSEGTKKCLVAKNLSTYVATAKISIINEFDLAEKIYRNQFFINSDFTFIGSEIIYNFVPHIGIGVIRNEYAQMNVPTPLLFDPENMVNDYKALISSKFSDDEILSKINEMFRNNKYIDDLHNPFINIYETTELDIVNDAPLPSQIERFAKIVVADKENLPKATKDIFLEIVLGKRSKEIEALEFKNEGLSKSFNLLINAVNSRVNKKMSGEQEATKNDFDFLSEIDDLEDFGFMAEIDDLGDLGI